MLAENLTQQILERHSENERRARERKKIDRWSIGKRGASGLGESKTASVVLSAKKKGAVEYVHSRKANAVTTSSAAFVLNHGSTRNSKADLCPLAVSKSYCGTSKPEVIQKSVFWRRLC